MKYKLPIAISIAAAITAGSLIFSHIEGSPAPTTVQAALPSGPAKDPTIRQEINIIDGYVGASSGSYATSSAIVQLDTTKYVSPTYYFEVVASTSASIASSIQLRNATSSAIQAVINIPAGTTSYTRLRSIAFNASSTAQKEFVAVVNNDTGATKGIIAARIIVVDAAASLTVQETQIEIGNQETYTANATSSLASPKYWTYTAANWDGSPKIYAEVTYDNITEPSPVTVYYATSTTYSTNGSFTYIVSAGATSTDVELWGGGGAGGTGDGTNRHGGGGAAGGQYAKKAHLAVTPGNSHTVVVANVQSTTATNGNDSTYDTNVVVAKGGALGSSGSGTPAGGSGSSTGCVGDAGSCFAGGSGAAGATTGSGGGGGGAGSTGAGGSSAGGQAAGSGTANGGGNGGAGTTNNTAQGGAGTQAGGGGAGSTKSATGGQGALGQAKLTEYGTSSTNVTATTTIALQEDDGTFNNWVSTSTIVASGTAVNPTRVRVGPISTPANGRHFRIVVSNGYNGATWAILNAKIIVDQGSVASSRTAGTVTFLDPGGDATFNVTATTTGGLYQFVNGTTGIATDFVHGSHIKSIKFGTSGGTSNNVVTNRGVIADSGARISAYVYLVAYPSGSGLGRFIELSTAAGGNPVYITTSTTGALQLWGNAQLGSNGPTLSLNHWYRISIAYTITSTTVNRFEVFLDGVSAISVTNATISSTGTTDMSLGNNTGDSTQDLRMSDIYADLSSSLADTGDIWVTAKRPNANGTTNGYTTQIGSGGSGYGTGHSPQINERAVSTTNGWSMIGAGSAVTEEYNIESKSTGDIDISNGTIVDYIGWIYTSALAPETGSIIVNNASSNISISTTNTVFTAVAGSTSYPAGTGADIGEITSTALTTVSLYEAGVMVAYIPPPAAITKLEPQYLLLNSDSITTGNQNYLQQFNCSEWSGVTLTEYHAQDAQGAGANAQIQDITAGSALTNSSVTGANQTISSALNLTTTQDTHTFDTNIVNAGTEVDASRLLIKVVSDGGTPCPSGGGGGTNPTKTINTAIFNSGIIISPSGQVISY